MIQEALDLFARWPFLWGPFVGGIWFVVSGVALTLLNKTMPVKDEEWAALFARKPRLAAALGLLKAVGLNVPAAVRWARSLLSGSMPAFLVSRPGDVASLIAMARQLEDFEKAALIKALLEK